MKRHDFLGAEISGLGAIALGDEDSAGITGNPIAIPAAYGMEDHSMSLVRTTTGIEPYSGPWNAKTAAHLLRRTIFGPLKSEIAYTFSHSLDSILTELLADQPQPSAPVDPAPGQTWLNLPYDSTNDGEYAGYLKAWWVGLMAEQRMSIREKMVLFWHNHFVSEYATVLDSRYMYKQNALFRQYALGNIKDLVKAVTADPAMLRYLNGNTNVAGKPNENYARELQELFTIGKGVERAPGDYTNYTEQDVKAAARVLTGWRDNETDATSWFDPTKHDTTDKVFSADYQSTVIKGRTGVDGTKELNDLVDLIFAQDETAKFLCRKLYRWFIYYDMDSTIEQNVIVPLANVMRTNNYEMKPVLNTLLRSAHFFDDNNIGCLIKNPMDFEVGAIRQTGMTLPNSVTEAAAYYSFMDSVRCTGVSLDMNIMDPPNVAGWSAYYQMPEYHGLWINTATLLGRGGFTDSLINGILISETRYAVDSIAYAKQVSVPDEPRTLIAEFASHLFPIDLTSNQKDYLLNSVLLLGLPDNTWSLEWGSYMSDPNNAQKKQAVASRLNRLLIYMMRMAEFQLS